MKKEKGEKTPHFVSVVPLVREQRVDDKLFPIFCACHSLYNECVAEVYRILHICEGIPEYAEAQEKVDAINAAKKEELAKRNITWDKFKTEDKYKQEYQELKEERNPYYDILRKYREENGLYTNKFAIQTNIVIPKKTQGGSKYVCLNSPIISSLSSSLGQSLEKYFYQDGKQVHFKNFKKGDTIYTIDGRRDKNADKFEGIKLCVMDDFKLYAELTVSYYGIASNNKFSTSLSRIYYIPILMSEDYIDSIIPMISALGFHGCKTVNDLYLVCKSIYDNGKQVKVQGSKRKKVELSCQNIGPCSIKYENIRGNRYYSLIVCIDGVPEQKFGLNSVEDASTNVCGIDMGMQIVALSFRHANGEVFRTELFELAEDIDTEYMNKLADVNRSMEHKRRINNPDNFNENGTSKSGKHTWFDSVNYKEEKIRSNTLNRKKTEITKVRHTELVKHILKYAHNIVIEPMDYSALAKRAKETTYRTVVDENGDEKQRANKKSRFGKSILKKSPATFVNILKKGVASVGGKYIVAEKFETKASQYNHITDEYTKKALNTRWNELEYKGTTLKIQRDLYSAFLLATIDRNKKIRKDLCDVGFEQFVALHNKCLNELDMSSYAIKNIL